MADSGQRDDLSASVGKLDCLRGYRWTCVDRFRRIRAGVEQSWRATDGPAQMRQDGRKAPGTCRTTGERAALLTALASSLVPLVSALFASSLGLNGPTARTASGGAYANRDPDDRNEHGRRFQCLFHRKSSGLTFNEETWARAKPLFIQAAKEFRGAADDITQLAKLLIVDLSDNYRMTEEALKEMRPYLIRFISEVRAGTISLEEDVSAR
jgi:hypothetical protein